MQIDSSISTNESNLLQVLHNSYFIINMNDTNHQSIRPDAAIQ